MVIRLFRCSRDRFARHRSVCGQKKGEGAGDANPSPRPSPKKKREKNLTTTDDYYGVAVIVKVTAGTVLFRS
jgi:hypothetical protein